LFETFLKLNKLYGEVVSFLDSTGSQRVGQVATQDGTHLVILVGNEILEPSQVKKILEVMK
jgi:hypothetical protein